MSTPKMSSMARIPKKRRAEEPADQSLRTPKQPFQPSTPSSSSGFAHGRNDSCKVQMNGFRMTLSRNIKIYKFELSLKAIFRKKSGEEAARELYPLREKDDFTVQVHRRALWDIFQSLFKPEIAQDQHLFGSNKYQLVYDCGLQLYSKFELFSAGSTRSGSIDTSALSDATNTHFSNALVRVEYELKRTPTADFTLGGKSENTEKDRLVQQFLEILTSQGLYAMDDNLLFRNQRYDCHPREGDEVVKSSSEYPFCVKLGSSKSVCLPQPKAGEAGASPILQLEKKTSAFFPSMSVESFVEKCSPSKYEEILKGLMVVTTHLRKNKTFRIHGVSKYTCLETKFLKGDRQISVADYFQEQYNKVISRSVCALPCVVQKNKRKREGGEFNYYPMNCLTILKGQRIFDKKQNPKIVEHLITKARVLPSEMAKSVENELRKKIMNKETARYLREFSVSIEEKLVETVAKLLTAPKIEYTAIENNGLNLTTNNGQKNAWKIGSNTFFRPGKITNSKKGSDRWLLVAVYEGHSTEQKMNDAIIKFADKLTKSAKMRGIEMRTPGWREIQTGKMDGDDLWNLLSEQVGKYAHVEEVKFVMFVQRERKDFPRDMMKLLETTYKLTTQQITIQTVKKASGKGGEMVLDNLLMKTNEKLGGVNCRIRPPLKCKYWFRRGVMYIGLDISHPGIASVSPTVVGMAFTKNELLEVEGRIWYQEPREHLIQKMKEYIVEAIEEFKKHSKVYPDDIIVYRGGVSEGEFDKVPDVEISQFKEAFRDKRLAFQGGRKPSLKYISVQRNSGYRLMPKQSHNFNGKTDAVRENVLPGTCADTGVVNEARKEFVLVPHQAIQGTAKPSKYVLLHDDLQREERLHNDPKEITMEQLELVTNTLCYTHGIVTSPVSCPSILYQAGDLAKRGLNNYKSYTARRSSPIPPQEATEEREAYFDELCEKLRVTLDNRFWA